ncbi:hypothetical protein GCM10023192_54220 [Amycolatopsis samaneae]
MTSPGCPIKIAITQSHHRHGYYSEWLTAERETPASNTKALHVYRRRIARSPNAAGKVPRRFLTPRQPGENLLSLIARAPQENKSDIGRPEMQMFAQHAHHAHDILTGVLAHLAHLLGWLV